MSKNGCQAEMSVFIFVERGCGKIQRMTSERY